MRFEWLNSRFVDAFINGYWILIENVNCCRLFAFQLTLCYVSDCFLRILYFFIFSAAVLDRLNACLENNGELNLQECGGGISIVKAHSDFRLLFINFTLLSLTIN